MDNGEMKSSTQHDIGERLHRKRTRDAECSSYLLVQSRARR